MNLLVLLYFQTGRVILQLYMVLYHTMKNDQSTENSVIVMLISPNLFLDESEYETTLESLIEDHSLSDFTFLKK